MITKKKQSPLLSCYIISIDPHIGGNTVSNNCLHYTHNIYTTSPASDSGGGPSLATASAATSSASSAAGTKAASPASG